MDTLGRHNNQLYWYIFWFLACWTNLGSKHFIHLMLYTLPCMLTRYILSCKFGISADVVACGVHSGIHTLDKSSLVQIPGSLNTISHYTALQFNESSQEVSSIIFRCLKSWICHLQYIPVLASDKFRLDGLVLNILQAEWRRLSVTNYSSENNLHCTEILQAIKHWA